MIFEFETGDGYSRIIPIFEDSDNYEGKRQEGPGTIIKYSGEPIEFDYEVSEIHPDLLGLACLSIFHPFIGESVTFPMPVSSRLKNAFDNKCFNRFFEFTNIDEDLPIYSGEKIAISFGGGIDSSAVRTAFPEALVIHEAHLKQGTLVPSHAHDVVRSIPNNMGKVITTNQRYVSRPGGWHGWTCSTITSLLLATDFNIGIILTGSILGSTLLNNGRSYWDRFRATAWHGSTGNYWQTAFQEIGIPMFSPMTGASEFITMKDSLNFLKSGQVVYCMEKDGGACNSCTKCFRRAVIRSVVDTEISLDLEIYNTEIIHSFLEKRPLYFGHIFSYARQKIELPDWILDRIENVPIIQTDWPVKLHPNIYQFVCTPWKEIIEKRMTDIHESMTDIELQEMELWTQ